jgi:hypothetical protein
MQAATRRRSWSFSMVWKRLSSLSKKGVVFDKNGRAFVKVIQTIQAANAGRLWKVAGAGIAIEIILK